MKKIAVVFAMSAGLCLGLAGRAYAFHSGGVAECQGCHTMHNSLEGVAMGTGTNNVQFQGVQYLLVGQDQSSTCLNCHGDSGTGGYHIFDDNVAAGVAPANLTPGGDFGWLKKNFTWSPRTGVTETSDGERHGHNVVAAEDGLVADATLTMAPGGNYPSTALTCISCHDPHGKYRYLSTGTFATTGEPIKASGSYNNTAEPAGGLAVGAYRLLAGTGYEPKSAAGVGAFAAQPPVAVAPSSYNRTEAVTETRVAYGVGMSEWCANCHASIHNNTLLPDLIHPAGNDAELGASYAALYDSYVVTGNLTGTNATSYNSLVPFEEGGDPATPVTVRSAIKPHAVNNGSVTTGPTATSNVMCLSCHRAHASGWDSMTRWSHTMEFLTAEANTWPGSDLDPATYPDASAAKFHMGRTVGEYGAAMGNKPASALGYQRSLCNKCHAKD